MICVSSIELFVIFLAVLWNGNIKPMAINSHNLKRGIIGELLGNRRRRFEAKQCPLYQLNNKTVFTCSVTLTAVSPMR